MRAATAGAPRACLHLIICRPSQIWTLPPLEENKVLRSPEILQLRKSKEIKIWLKMCFVYSLAAPIPKQEYPNHHKFPERLFIKSVNFLPGGVAGRISQGHHCCCLQWKSLLSPQDQPRHHQSPYVSPCLFLQQFLQHRMRAATAGAPRACLHLIICRPSQIWTLPPLEENKVLRSPEILQLRKSKEIKIWLKMCFVYSLAAPIPKQEYPNHHKFPERLFIKSVNFLPGG